MFDFGKGNKWPGIAKLIEEAGELIQVCGKLMGSRGHEDHWDGTNLRERLHEEIGDVLAACEFIIARCGLDRGKIRERIAHKLGRYNSWHENADANQRALEA